MRRSALIRRLGVVAVCAFIALLTGVNVEAASAQTDPASVRADGTDTARAARMRDTLRVPSDSLLMVGASVAPDTATVGDRLVLTLTAVHDFDTAIAFPRIVGEIAPFEVIDIVIYPSDEGPDGVVERRDVVITVFETGEHVIPELAFHAVMSGGDTAVVYSPSLEVLVRSVIPPEDLEGQIEPRAIKPPLDLPRAVWPWILAAVVAAALVAAWRLWVRWRASRPEPGEESGPSTEERRRAAHVSALERLRTLRSSDDLDRGDIETFYVELTDITRRYVGDRFSVPAIDRTTAELAPELSEVALPEEQVSWLTGLLERADLSKFAKSAPAIERGREDLEDVEGFVEETRLRASEEEGDDVPVR